MNVPEISTNKSNSIFEFDWSKEKIHIQVKNVRADKTDVTGIIRITTSASGYAPNLHWGRMNFLAANTRATLEKTLDKLYPECTNWHGILDQLAYFCVERVTKGAPVETIDMASLEDIKPPEYLIYPLLAKNEPTILFGDGGSFKSYVSVILGYIASLPHTAQLFKLSTTNTTGIKTLILDYERSKNLMLWRLKCLRDGMNLEPTTIDYRRCSTRFSDEMDVIQQLVDDTKAELVVIDSVGAACAADMNAPETATTLFNALRTLNVTSLLITHNSKGADAKSRTPFGSVYFWNEASAVWEIVKAQNAGDDRIRIGLYNRKNNIAKLQEPLGFEIQFTDNTTFVVPCKAEDIPGYDDNLPLADKIYSYLAQTNASTVEALASVFALSKSAVARELTSDKRFVPISTQNGQGGMWDIAKVRYNT